MPKIDLSYRMYECIPRVIWQQLFNFYRENCGDLGNLDNLLIDYENCKKFFDQCVDREKPITFIFGMCEKSGNTTWIEEEYFWEDIQVRIAASSFDHHILCTITQKEFSYEVLN